MPEILLLTILLRPSLRRLVMLCPATYFPIRPTIYGFSWILFCFISSIGVIFNGLLFCLIWKHKGFHQPYMYVRLVYIILDFFFALTVIFQSVFNGVGVFGRINCFISLLTYGFYFMTIQFTAYLAVERFFYFCKPMVYPRYFTGRSIISITTLIFVLCFGYLIATEILIGRVKHANVNTCTLPNQRFHSVMQWFVFFIPAIVCTCVSAFKIKKLLTQLENLPHATPPSFPTGSDNFGPVVRQKTGKKALR